MQVIRYPLGATTRIQRTAGAGTIKFGLYSSTDGVTWIALSVISSASGVLAPANIALTIDVLLPTVQFLAIATSNSNGATTGLIREFHLSTMVLLPPSYRIARV